MKKLPVLLLLLAATPIASMAQPKARALQVVVDPAAKKLLDKATATYHAAKGVRFNLQVTMEKDPMRYSVSFQKPNLFHVEGQEAAGKFQLISDGKASYLSDGTTYERNAPLKPGKDWPTLYEQNTASLMPGLLAGRSPVLVIQDKLKNAPFPGLYSRMTVVVPPPAVVEGVSLHGVKFKVMGGHTKDVPGNVRIDLYLWFDSKGLLRRISEHDVSDMEGDSVTIERISAQQLNPTFAPDTFKFDAKGLQPAAKPPA